jgi:hypothetical protein
MAKFKIKKVKVAKLPKPPKLKKLGGKKSYPSDTGGRVKILKGTLDPSKHDSSRLKDFG